MPVDTFELTVRPKDSATKIELVAWLEAHHFENIAYGVVDGIEDSLAAAEDHFAFADGDASPLAVYFDTSADAESLAARLAAAFGSTVTCRLTRLSNVAWQHAWDLTDVPLETANFAVVRPPRTAQEVERTGRIPLVIGPGESFGDGRHATTQVALEVLESACRPAAEQQTPLSMLDVGTGSGILAIAASYLGYQKLVGTDIDAGALTEARRNAIANGVSLDLYECCKPPDDGRLYDLIAANILAPVLHELMPVLAMRLAPGGNLLLAGFTEKDEAALVSKAVEEGLEIAARRECRGWVGLLLRMS